MGRYTPKFLKILSETHDHRMLDMCCRLHSIDWILSGDCGEEDFRECAGLRQPL